MTAVCCLLALLPTGLTVIGWVVAASVYLLLPTAMGRRKVRAAGGAT